ncbi:L,D-transpeptidase family protein [Salinivibrio sp. ES.052]|uniref:L,D-transpeptidase family protein n=1 Tax=Salinivibrio sp. ES.052 TaxID=1882823 RepID=UPI00094135B8
MCKAAIQRFLACVVLWALAVPTAFATPYPLPTDGSRLVGYPEAHIVKKGEHLEAIAKHYDMGFLALLALNPGIDPYLPEPGSLVRLPNQLLLPSPPHSGIVINLAELRLYYFPEPDAKVTGEKADAQRDVHVFPIGIGRVGRETPTMNTYISQKREHPTWTPPQSIRDEYKKQRGISLPDVVPAGPNNPLGDHALRLGYGNGEYLIHGTNKSFGIGLRVSAGCIRLRPDDVGWLFEQVDVHTPVRIINQPAKLSVEPDGRVMVEAHRPLSKNERETKARLSIDPDPQILAIFERLELSPRRYRAALSVQEGTPIEVVALTPAQRKAWQRLAQAALEKKE